MAEKKEKRYVSDNAQLMSEWNWEKNNELNFNPEILTLGSNKKAWWKCSKGHEWQATIANRITSKTGCPYCSGKKVLSGFNDLLTQNPSLASEWHPTKNGDLLPTMVPIHSGKKIWWECVNGHEWQATIANRVKGRGCPYCSGHKVISGINDLSTLYPNIAIEWNTMKNGDLSPTMVSSGSRKKVWWKCRKGHEWQAVVYSRTHQQTGCPICQLEQQTSFPEQAILFYCNQVTHADSRNMDFGKEIDIYLQEYKIGIEYNGIFWHKNKKDTDSKKVEFFANKNIRIVTIAEGDQNIVIGDTIEYVYNSSNKDSLTWAIKRLFELIGFDDVIIDVVKDASKIYDQYITIEKESSLASKYPEIAMQWNHERNLSLKPEMVTPASNKKIWWKCQNGHEWQASIASRNKGVGCPYCSGRYAIKGKNDVKTVNPILANEWNYEKNKELMPTDIKANSGKKVWWKCSKGHEWEASIASRNKGRGCPYCSGNKVLKGYNDLQTVNQTLAREWNCEKNNGLTPMDVMSNSHKKVWWKCEKGHEWQAIIASRNGGRGCPVCAREKRSKRK